MEEREEKMAQITRVEFIMDGNTHQLTYNSTDGEWQASITAPTITSWNLPDHIYPTEVTVWDEAGNSVNITVDDATLGDILKLRVKEITPPTPTIQYPTDGAVVSVTDPTIVATLLDETDGSGVDTILTELIIDDIYTIPVSSIQFTPIVGGYHMEYKVSPPAEITDGEHTIKLTITDFDGNVSTQEVSTFTVLSTTPILNITNPAEETSLTNQPSLTITGSTYAPSVQEITIEIFLNGVSAGTATVLEDGTFSHPVTLIEGTNTIRVVATNAAEHSAEVDRTVVLDTTPPIVTGITLTPNPTNVGVLLTITVTATDA